MLQSAFCPLEHVSQIIWHPLYMVRLRYINPPLQQLGLGISSAFGVYGPRQGDISTPLHSGLAEEYHAPSKHMGQECLPGHISTPFTMVWPRNIMHLWSAWAKSACQGIHPPPFTAGQPRNIIGQGLWSTWAEGASQGIYPPPFTVDGLRNIMYLLSAWAESACQSFFYIYIYIIV